MSSPAAAVAASVAGVRGVPVPFSPCKARLESMKPLLVDVAVPLVSYYESGSLAPKKARRQQIKNRC
ncbi:hypothetical protein [Streptomyces sp. NBC_00057]|uniref:hypothetical protein n=1 Tax=Streptomyces sp. NBC_00057 TaxID=2975634 RepID=UPI00324C3A3D